MPDQAVLKAFRMRSTILKIYSAVSAICLKICSELLPLGVRAPAPIRALRSATILSFRLKMRCTALKRKFLFSTTKAAKPVPERAEQTERSAKPVRHAAEQDKYGVAPVFSA